MARRGFDAIAPWYDLLVRIVFGSTMLKAQTCFLDRLSKKSSILVLGGGTGRWMKNVLQRYPESRIVYIESSAAMMDRARRNVEHDNRVIFRIGTEDNIFDHQKFDVVVTFCYLDIFTARELETVINKIKSSVRPGGEWLVTDFVSSKWWHRWMLVVMYKFFRLTAKLRNQHLPDWEYSLLSNGVEKKDEKLFYAGFIKSAVYKVT